MIGKSIGIYIHVPFCAKKCPYCDFYSTSYKKNTADSYIDAVIRNINAYSNKGLKVDTIYFGGGTPSLLSGNKYRQVIDEINGNFDYSSDCEVTIEVNPSTVNEQKLCEYSEAGINRISVGVQSMIDSELKLLGRLHNSEEVKETLESAIKAGFKNISCDLMIGLPNQKKEDVEYSISEITDYPITHVSSYILKVEEGTEFSRKGMSKQIPDDDCVSELYLHMRSQLEKRGFKQYEISNFSKEGYQSRHNLKYWQCDDYLGIGPAAHSCFGGKRFAVDADLQSFVSDEKQSTYITEETPYTFEEKAMLRLRLSDGLEISDCPEEKRKLILKKIPMLEKNGYIVFNEKKIALTSKGFLMSNSIIEYLIFE